MKVLALICRILLALIFIVTGANMVHPFLPMPQTPPTPLVGELMHALMASGWIKLLGGFQILGGLLVLLGGTTPLGLCILCPITVNILCTHAFLMGGHGIVPGLLTAVLEVVLLYAYRESFSGIFSTGERPAL